MDIDERHCPQCGHDVLNWNLTCPGCDQIPYNTPAGRKVVARRRSQHWWHDNAVLLCFGVLLIVAVAGGVVAAVNSPDNLFCPMPNKKVRAVLQEISDLGKQLNASDTPHEQKEAARSRLLELQQSGEESVIRQSAGWILAIAEMDLLEQQLTGGDLSTEQRALALGRLWEFFQKGDELTKRHAAWALADARDRRVVPFLLEQMGGDETDRMLVNMKLSKLAGEEKDWNRAQWKRWWKAHKDDPQPEMASTSGEPL